MRATFTKRIPSVGPVDIGVRVSEDVTAEYVRVRVPDASVSLLLTVEDLDRLKASILAKRPAVDAGESIFANELSESGA